MKKGSKKIKGEDFKISKGNTEEFIQPNAFYLKFMHLGKGRMVAKQFDTKEEAIEFGKKTPAWMDGGSVKYPELVVEPGVLELI